MPHAQTRSSTGLERMAWLSAMCLIAAVKAWGSTPEVNIANGPLFGGHANVHPNMVLSLSLEFSSAGSAYRGDSINYNKMFEYVGYFNPLKCYTYRGGNRNITDGYFAISKAADAITHECGGDSFSGNFMNWAASSTLDILRYGLTGGDRIVDTADTTILQRAILKESFYANDAYFPRRTLTAGGAMSAPSQVTPFNVATLYVVSCGNRILFGDSKNSDGNCDTSAYDKNGRLAKTDKKLGEYLARVKVCDAAEGATRADLCQQYGKYTKPVGEIQRRAHQIRFAAMGYLLDDSVTRYGGVLRAPMKYVGAKKFEGPGFAEAVNDRAEWDASTGVFYSNPENPSDRNSATTNSGVINYLNKFGRSGIYKTLDPISELYYEAIRYLQGKQPTRQATVGMTDAMRDGFPVLETWTDPIIASCQQSTIVAIGDANTNWDRYVPGNNRTSYNNGSNANDFARAADAAVAGKTPELDVKRWTRKVGEMEADAGGAHANPAPRKNLRDLENADTGADGHGTYYIAGLAYWANTNDIRLDKPTRVKTAAIDVDEGGNGLIDGSVRPIKPRDSQLYLAAKYGGFDDKNNDGNPYVTFAADGKTILKWKNSEWDESGSGVPRNYFLAGQPKEMIRAIRKIFSGAENASGTMPKVSASSSKIMSDGAFVYQAGFDPSTWSGSLKKMKLVPDGANGEVRTATSADWDAGEVLTGLGAKDAEPDAAARNIFVTRSNADNNANKSLGTVEFKWDKLSADQKTLLNASPVDGKGDGLGEHRLNYLRGMRNLELGRPGGMFRQRDRVLGDIINSNPVYVGAPAANAQGAGYQKFHDDCKGRIGAVYVGANDGMLHAFDAANGRELFAYIPAALMQRVNQLTAPGYAHRPYADGEISVSDAQLGSGWKTILAAGMGGGAQGLFALDVTNPSAFGAGMGTVLEFTDGDDADMGNLVSAPVIAKFRTRVTNGVPEYQYFIVAASGFNNYRDDGAGKFDTAAPGALFLLSLDKGAAEKWRQGANYYKFKTPISEPNQQNGLSAPALVMGSDGAVRYAYAGDLQGNLWRFDFTASAPWPAALGRSSHTPLFTAKDSNGIRQAITAQPKVVFAPGGGYVVLFGTGKFVEEADAAPGNFKSQSFYGIVDSTHDGDKVSGRKQLAPRVLTKGVANGRAALTVTGDAFDYGGADENKKGWYFDFVESDKTGERSVSSAVAEYGRLFFNSMIPGGDPCGAGGGRTYAIDALTGLPPGGNATGFLSQVGMMSTPVLFETGAVRVGERNAIGKRVVKRKQTVFNFGAGGVSGTAAPAQDGAVEVGVPAGRTSWREVLNWKELRDAAKKR